MTLCDDGHDEVCYEGRFCPACVWRIKAEGMEQVIDNMRDEIKDLERRDN
jgi:hypothetical protein